jgi:carbonic anhydrase
VFDQDAGALCVVRSAGHVLDRAILGSVEFTVTDLAVPLVLVLGHEDCRAVAAAVDAARGGRRPSGSRGYLVDEIGPAVVEAGTGSGALDRATRSHVRRTVARLRRAGTGGLPVEVVGAVYQLDTGRVEFL